MSFIWALIVGGVIGWLAGLVLGKDIPGGIIGNIIAGFVGAWLGTLLLGNWGPVSPILRSFRLLSGQLLWSSCYHLS